MSSGDESSPTVASTSGGVGDSSSANIPTPASNETTAVASTSNSVGDSSSTTPTAPVSNAATAVASTSGGAGQPSGATPKMLLDREINEHLGYKTSREKGTLTVKFTTNKVSDKDNNQRWRSECTITSPGIDTVRAVGHVCSAKAPAEHTAADAMREYLLTKRHYEGVTQ